MEMDNGKGKCKREKKEAPIRRLSRSIERVVATMAHGVLSPKDER
jgi:hypothetical protein